MRIKTISRSKDDYIKEKDGDVDKIHHNIDEKYHPFQQQREYVRALNAVKLDKVFAKPFIGALSGHADGVWCTCTNPKSLVQFISGACDGEIRVWDLPSQKTVFKVQAHRRFVRGLVCDPSGKTFYSCSDDKTIKRYRLAMSVDDQGVKGRDYNPEPLNVWYGKEGFNSIDHSWKDDTFVSCSSVVSVWSPERQEPIHTFSYETESLLKARFNPAEVGLLAATSNERGVLLYDIRASSILRKVQMSMVSNDIAWNPREPMNFTVANEDYNLYTFDMRNLSQPLVTHHDHVGAVLAVAYSSTGREFVSGSYDRTLRIWDARSARSREVYHTRRMQRIFCVNFSADGRFVLSGSDDTNIRIWKAQASAPLYKPTRREEQKLEYMDSLKRKYAAFPEISRIARHRHLPKVIKKMKDKEENKKKKDVKEFNEKE
ncbi:hypothetical protein WA588_005182 [Blastocystis sp. NMH]